MNAGLAARGVIDEARVRGGELVLSAPEGCTTDVMERFVREKRFWIYTKLAEKDALAPSVPKKQFVGGEGFPYLGRSYRLLLGLAWSLRA